MIDSLDEGEEAAISEENLFIFDIILKCNLFKTVISMLIYFPEKAHTSIHSKKL